LKTADLIYPNSIVLPPTCRFTPTCSQYALDAIRRYGVWKGAGWPSAEFCGVTPFMRGLRPRARGVLDGGHDAPEPRHRKICPGWVARPL